MPCNDRIFGAAAVLSRVSIHTARTTRRPICYIWPFQKDTVGIVIESSRITNERRPLAAPLLPTSFINEFPCLSIGKFHPNSYGLRALGLFIPGGFLTTASHDWDPLGGNFWFDSTRLDSTCLIRLV